MKPTCRKSLAGNLLDLTLGPSRSKEDSIAKFESVYNLLIIGPRGLQCETHL